MHKKNSGISDFAQPDRVRTYFALEWKPLLAVTITGIIYNVGMTAGPWFEGQLAQMLCDIIGGQKALQDMLRLAAAYVAVILFVQIMRYVKRFYIRRFANSVSRNMKHVLYRNLVHKSHRELNAEQVGGLMTKAISDVDTCVEGMRKFTTEIFDTGVVMAAYLVMLFSYDWRLALISCIFPPFAYLLAERLKKTVSRCAAAYKESAGRLNGETLDRVSGALTYRILGEERARDAAYEGRLADYEKKAMLSGVLETTMQPLYQIISSASMIFIVWFGVKNVQGTGWAVWNIAAFTTFLSCFAKLAVKSSKAAKLFNAVQKARVSWVRIKPLMRTVPPDKPVIVPAAAEVSAQNLTLAYPDAAPVLRDVGFTALPGQIIGVTGPVACGKSTLGRAFLCEDAYTGSLCFGGKEFRDMSAAERRGTVCWMGHDPELISDTIAENIRLGDDVDVRPYLKAVCIDAEVDAMPDGENTPVGSGGVRLSGGQQARIALARTLCHRKPVIVLDDPFSALDRKTEQQVFEQVRRLAADSIVILISHRLYLFPSLDKVLWLNNGTCTESTHEQLMRTEEAYRGLYLEQTGGGAHEEQ